MINCEDCNRQFVNQSCFERHKNETKICKIYIKCPTCSKIYDNKHECGKRLCKYCKLFVPYEEHYCYISPLCRDKLIEEDQTLRVFIFYDLESMLVPQKLNVY